MTCGRSRTAIGFEQSLETRKFGLRSPLKLRTARQFVPSQFLCSEELLHISSDARTGGIGHGSGIARTRNPVTPQRLTIDPETLWQWSDLLCGYNHRTRDRTVSTKRNHARTHSDGEPTTRLKKKVETSLSSI